MQFLLLATAAVVALWALCFMLRGSLVAGCVATIIATACFGYTFWHPSGTVPMTIDRAIAVLLVATYFVHRRLGRADPKPLGRAEWVLLGFLFVLVASTLLHDWHYEHGQPVAHLVIYWLVPAAVYWIARQARLSDRTVRRAMAALAGVGIYLAFTSLAEATGQWWAVFPRYIASPKLEFFGRARGPFVNPAALGVYLAVSLCAALTFWPRFSRAGRLALFAFAFVALAGIFATLTRSAWIGGAASVGTFLALSLPYQWRRLLFVGAVAGGLALVTVKGDSLLNMKRDVHLDAAAAKDSAQLRPILAKVAFNMFLDQPLFGFGFGQYDRAKLPYVSDRSDELPLEKSSPYVQHNALLALLTDTGMLGMGMYLLTFCFWTGNAWRLWSTRMAPQSARYVGLLFLSLIGAYMSNALFHDTNIIEGVNLLVFFLAGITSGLTAMYCPATTRFSLSCAAGRPRQLMSPAGNPRCLATAGMRR